MLQTIVLKINGMHCASCAINIDGELEDMEGVISSHANYAKQQAEVKFETEKISLGEIKEAIKKVGYQVE